MALVAELGGFVWQPQHARLCSEPSALCWPTVPGLGHLPGAGEDEGGCSGGCHPVKAPRLTVLLQEGGLGWADF